MTTVSDRTKQEYTTHFVNELSDARIEVSRLNELLKDVIWYNFETCARSWKVPWRETMLDSVIQLVAHRYSRFAGVEVGEYPLYYYGPIRKAPACPPQILVRELEIARAHVDHCEAMLGAAYDWAPGGALYEELRRLTMVGK